LQYGYARLVSLISCDLRRLGKLRATGICCGRAIHGGLKCPLS
jgi:hypothetical protein